MAEVQLPGHHDRHSSMSPMMSPAMAGSEPVFEMVPNPTFSFPMRPQAPSPSGLPTGSFSPRRRPTSMQLGVPGAQPGGNNPHRRTTSALPSFSFNAADVSGLQESTTPPITPDEPSPSTPRRGHKRGGSEFVGGDSRFGVSNAISTSPTSDSAPPAPAAPSNALPVPQPAGRRGHAHRRSAALSSHDVRNIMLPSEPTPRLSSSLPTTPLDHPAGERPATEPANRSEEALSASDREGSPTRPASRPRVGFSENVEIIPRPLSTISSETGSSMSTIRGHSVSNSISSVMSMNTPSPPSSRHPRRSLSTNSVSEINERTNKVLSSVEISKRVEKEGEWLKSKSSGSSVGGRSVETGALSPALTVAASDPPPTPSHGHRLRHSLGHSLGFDRRRSEPSISMRTGDPTRMSALSLQEPGLPGAENPETEEAYIDRRSSTRRIKEWAFAKLHRRSRDMSKLQSASSQASPPLVRPQSEGSGVVLGRVQLPDREPEEPAMAETDLDAVFKNQTGPDSENDSSDAPEPRVQFNTPTFNTPSSYQPNEDDLSPMVDLDAALGPMRTPPIGGGSQKKQLHSVARAPAGPSGYLHRRAESAPTLMPFEFPGTRGGTPSQSSMADVFEEEEEEDEESNDGIRPHTSHGTGQNQEPGVGISVVDADHSGMNFGVDDGLQIQNTSWEPERPSTSHGNMSVSSRLSHAINERRASSVIEDTIVEEGSPVDPQSVEIVEDHEEPRASSLTKSSDSSETPTLLASQRDSLPVIDAATSVTTPETYQPSTFSSPDFARHQGSFDTSRLGTSASSITDNRTMSSCTTGEPPHDLRMSVDDVPSLTSSRSTMLSTAHANTSRRDFGSEQRNSSGASSTLDPSAVAERRRKRSSIQSLSQLMGGSFGSRADVSEGSRPQTATEGIDPTRPAKKEHRLKKLMFWRSKQGGRHASLPNRLHKDPPAP